LSDLRLYYRCSSLWTSSLGIANLIGAEDLDEEVAVKSSYDECEDGGQNLDNEPINELAHHLPRVSEVNQGNDGKGKGERQDDLAQNKELARCLLSSNSSNYSSWYDCDKACDQPANPRPDADVDEALHHNLARQSAGDGGILATAQQRHAKEDARRVAPKGRGQQLVRRVDVDIGVGVDGVVEGRGRQDEDGRIHKEREAEGDGRVEGPVQHRHALALGGAREVAGLDDAGVQEQVVRHHGGAQDPEADVQLVRVGDDGGMRVEPGGHLGPVGAGHRQLVGKAARNGGHQDEDEQLKEAEVVQPHEEDEDDVQAGDEDPRPQGDAKQQVQGNGGPNDLRQVRGGNGDLNDDPQDVVDALGVRFPASQDAAAQDGAGRRRKRRGERGGHIGRLLALPSRAISPI
jgi:hypothetical protein